MKRAEGIAYLTRCADQQGQHWCGGITWPPEDCPTCRGSNDAGHLSVPCSRYGRTSASCAPVAWRLAYLIARDSGEDIDEERLEHAMSLVVNDHDDVAYVIRSYGHRQYT